MPRNCLPSKIPVASNSSKITVASVSIFDIFSIKKWKRWPVADLSFSCYPPPPPLQLPLQRAIQTLTAWTINWWNTVMSNKYCCSVHGLRKAMNIACHGRKYLDVSIVQPYNDRWSVIAVIGPREKAIWDFLGKGTRNNRGRLSNRQTPSAIASTEETYPSSP